MTAQLLYLIRTESKNRFRRQLARLRNPRYAAALAVGLLYFFFAFGGPFAFGGRAAPAPATSGLMGIVRQLGPLLLALYAAMVWLLGRGDALAFRPAEVNLLFTGPLGRRDLLRYKLLHGHVPLLFSASFMTLISHGTGLPWWLRLPSFWVLLTILHLHHTAAALVHASMQQQGLSGWRRNWIPIVVFGSATALLLTELAGPIGAARATGSLQQGAAILAAALEQPIPSAVLTPFRLALGPLVSTVDVWPAAFGLALVVALAHYVWLMLSNTAFEEVAAEAGERRARAVQAVRSGGGWRAYTRAMRQTPDRPARRRKAARAAFHLHTEGAPAVAIIWKNLTFAVRGSALRSPVSIGVMAAVVVALMNLGGSSLAEGLEQVGAIALIFGAVLTLLGPLMIRNDLRMDLQQIGLLRTMPLPAHQLVTAEIASSAITLSLIQLALLAFGTILVSVGGGMPVSPLELALATVGVLLLAPALATLGVTIQCAIALTFPAWVQLGPDRAVGVEAMGQNILTMVGSLLLLVLLLILPVLGAAAGVIMLSTQAGPQLAPAGAALGIAVVYGEIYLTTRALGRLFERTDPSDVGLAR